MSVLKKMRRRLIMKHDGIPICFIVYKPQKEGKNVFFNHIHPDIKQDAVLNDLLGQVGERVRNYYEQHPEQLKEIFEGRMKNGR